MPCHKNNHNHNHNKADLFYGDLIISEIVFVFANFFHEKEQQTFDQSESGFFNQKLDQIADQLGHKIRKWKSLGRGYLETFAQWFM